MPDPRKLPKSKYTADRGMPGAFEGETVTRRNFMNLTVQGAGIVAASAFLLPAVGFAAGSAIFDRPKATWETVGAVDDFVVDNYLPRVITTVTGIGEIGKDFLCGLDDDVLTLRHSVPRFDFLPFLAAHDGEKPPP